MKAPNSPPSISKQHAAHVQLDMAIKLYFEHLDLVSAYTLAAAADGILEGIYKNQRDEILSKQFARKKPEDRLRFAMSEEFEILIKSQHFDEAVKALRHPQNFFKHADKDPDGVLEFHAGDRTQGIIMGAIMNYTLIFDECSPAMNVFFNWIMIGNPKLIKEGTELKEFLSIHNITETFSNLSESLKLQLGYKNLRQNCPELFVPSHYGEL